MSNIVKELLKLAIPIEDVRPDPRNARLHPQPNLDAIKRSLEQYGQRKPIVVNSETGIIEAGNGLWQAAKELGWDKIAAVKVKDNPETATAYSLMDNQSALLADWDVPMLKDLLQELDTGAFDMDLTGFSEKALEELMTQLRNPEGGLTDDDEVPEQVETICKAGDLWQLGEHRLLCGDATKSEDVGRLMGGEKAVLMATDPPYGDSWVQKAKDMHKHGYGHSRAELHGSIEGDDKNETELANFLADFLGVAKIAGDPPFPVFVWHGAKRILYEQALIGAGYLVHQPVVWVKPSFVIGRLHYHPQCEWALHGWLRGKGKCPFYGKRNQSDIWVLGRENDKLHPTQKPVRLFEIPIENHTQVSEICYEPFAGSGTQFIACEKLNRRCYGLEIEPRYCDVIITRWQNFTGKQAVKIE